MRISSLTLAVLALATVPPGASLAQESAAAAVEAGAVPETAAPEPPAPRVADFQPVSDGVASLVPGQPGQGAFRFFYEGVFAAAAEGWPQNLLDIHVLVENRSPDPVLIRSFDLWVTTVAGAVLSQPRLVVDGEPVDQVEVAAGADMEVEALFALGPTPAFDAFTLNWSARIGAVSRTGALQWRAATEGYRPPPAPQEKTVETAAAAGVPAAGEAIPFDIAQQDDLVGDDRGDIPADCLEADAPVECDVYFVDGATPYDPYFYDPYPRFTFGLHYGYGPWAWWGSPWWGWGFAYPYYPVYAFGHQVYHDGGRRHGYHRPGYGSGIRTKEREIARRAGHAEHRGHHDRALTRTDTSLRRGGGGLASGRAGIAGREGRSRTDLGRSPSRTASRGRPSIGRSTSTRPGSVDRRATPRRSRPSIGRSGPTTGTRSGSSFRSSRRGTSRRPGVGRSTGARSRSSVSRPSSRSSGRSGSSIRSGGRSSSSRGGRVRSPSRSSGSRGGSMSRGGGSRGGSRGGGRGGGRGGRR